LAPFNSEPDEWIRWWHQPHIVEVSPTRMFRAGTQDAASA
jgi:hypothetical protein